MKSYERVNQLFQPQDSEHAYGSIQWKGTDVCMDIYCKCGKHLHADASFLYFVKCGHCSRTYRVSPYVMLMELKEDEMSEVFGDHVLKEDD